MHQLVNEKKKLWLQSLVSNFRHVLNVACFLLGNSPESEFCIPTFRNTLFHLHRQVGMKNDWGWEYGGIYMGKCLVRKYLPADEDRTDSVPKRRYIKFRRRGITQKKAYNIQNTAEVRNQESPFAVSWPVTARELRNVPSALSQTSLAFKGVN